MPPNRLHDRYTTTEQIIALKFPVTQLLFYVYRATLYVLCIKNVFIAHMDTYTF